MRAAVYVAGVGVISAIGDDAAGNLASLRAGRAGMGRAQFLDTVHRDELPVAEVKLDNETLAERSGLPAFAPRTAMLSWLAAAEALRDAGLDRIPGLRKAFVSANTVGGMDRTEDFFPAYLADPAAGRLRQVAAHECGAVTEWVADRLGLQDFVSTVSTACSSSANAIFTGARLIAQGIVDVAVAGGADALTRFTLNGFHTLMILDAAPCKPFDENRKGLNLGEGAGYLAMVSERVMHALGGAPYARMAGYCNANDAYHQTASSPEGTGSFLAMQGALASAGLHPADVDYINLHGTGTPNNDIAEGTAIAKLFGAHYPPMSSTKSFTGHTLGASGGVEAVYSALAIRHGLVFPNLRLETPMQALPFTVQTTLLENQRIGHVLSNSFGFGGNCTSLIFSAA